VPTIKRLAADQLAAAGRVDRRRVRATTDEEIARQIAADADTAPEIPDDAAAAPRVVRRPTVPDVRDVRARLGLSQAAFAERFGLSTRTVQEWEQGRAVPDQPARVLLKVILDAPEAVARAVRAS
jgi:putative transcriptional regulator